LENWVNHNHTSFLFISLPAKTTVIAKCVVLADGANSSLAQSLGIINEPPNACAGRAYVKGYTHSCRAHQVTFYPKSSSLPASMIRFSQQVENYINLSCFSFLGVILGEKREKVETHIQRLKSCFQQALKNTYIRSALGPSAQISPFEATTMRVGGAKKTYAEALVIVGEAAGLVDPISGCGIHLAMKSAELASQVIKEGFENGDLSEKQMKKYQTKWRKMWAWDFLLGNCVLNIIAEYPNSIDSAVRVIHDGGTPAILRWAQVVAGITPLSSLLSWFVRPDTFLRFCGTAIKKWVHVSLEMDANDTLQTELSTDE